MKRAPVSGGTERRPRILNNYMVVKLLSARLRVASRVDEVYNRGVGRLLVLGDERLRAIVAERRSGAGQVEAVECDPALGDCVMYVRLEGARYSGFVFLGWSHPVTRGALAIVAERAVLLPLWAPGDTLDTAHEGYLLRLPRALGFRDEGERDGVLEAVPKASEVPSEIVGPDLGAAALARLVGHVSSGSWRWAELVAHAAAEAGEP